jgi:CRP/FNR family transcriptional regulator
MRHSCRKCTVRSQALCSALPLATLERLNRLAYRKRVGTGQMLLSPDEAGCVVATILQGVAKVSVSLADGRTQVVGLLFPSEFVGRPFAASSAPFIEAATDMELCCFPRARFEDLLNEHRSLEALYVQRITDQLDAAREWMLLLGHKTAEERVASLVQLCLQKHRAAACPAAGDGGAGGCRFELPLSRSDMAQFLGLTLETVSRMLRRLANAGAIGIGPGRALAVLDEDRLARLAEQTDAAI